MTQIRRATTSDVPALMPLVDAYWRFEQVAGFESQRVAAPLARLLSDSRSGMDRVGQALLNAAEVEFVHAGCTNVSLQLPRQNDAARAFYHLHGYTERVGFELLDKMLETSLRNP